MNLNLILLLCLLPDIRNVSGSSYLSKTMAQRTQNMPVYSIHISQGSVATRLRCGGIFNDILSQIFRRVC